MLQPFCDSFSCNSMPRSGCPALHGVIPILKKSILNKSKDLSFVLFWGFFSKKAHLHLYLYICECRFLESYIQYQNNKKSVQFTERYCLKK